MGGLKPEITDGIRMFKPKSLKEAISLDRMRDEQLNRQKKAIRLFHRTTTDSLPMKLKSASPMKRLTWDEMQKKRAQGLCFNCDEKFVPGHKCKRPQLLLLEGNYDESETDDEERAYANFRGELEISLHAFTGWSTTKTIRISAKVGPRELIVLIDSGSTYNFINVKIAELFQLSVVPTEPFNVKVANGDPLKCQGRKGSSFIEKSLVQRKRLPKEHATWENTQELRNRFINLNLEDKVPLKEGQLECLSRIQDTRIEIEHAK
ncbi:hypothetical protein F0562_002876 [Nyssa sinensis]|uniref:Uncharacterized protein n=1 Tax=Nyssa sinensis TaxID=561372 RepID=A0A5J5BTQ8_9ASTE|nr:hypothetical protein F0562_002876 [Nyssa sinensis]